MLTPEIFVRFVSSKGKKLSEINPGSDEVALVPAKAIEALKLLEGSQVAVLGGDVLSDSSGKLAYNYENWYCEQLPGESPLDFVRRSQSIAHDFLAGLAMRHDPNLFVVLVHSELGVD